MEKLIELLNEYGHTSSCWPFETYRIEPATDYISSYLVLSRDDNWEWDWKDWHLPIPRLISKEYWFIKWLVENDKIDFHIWSRWEKYLEYPIWSDNLDEVHDYKDIIQRLSISDTPIEDLISYLK
jgi:hypothetical protein